MQYTGLVNCSFHDNHGTALVVNNTNSTVFRFTGTNNFIDNQVAGENDGGAIITLANTLVSFNGMTNFIREKSQMVAQSSYQTIMFLVSMELATSLITQQVLVVVHHTVMYLPSMKPATSTTQQIMHGVVQSLHYTTLLGYGGTSNFSYNSADHDDGVSL